MKTTVQSCIAAALCAVALVAAAHSYRTNELTLEHPWAHVTLDGASVAPVYMIIRNHSKQADSLIGGSAPGVAERVELRGLARGTFSMSTDKVEKIDVPAGGQEQLAPHAAHVILVGIKKPLKRGDQLPLTLQFKNGGKIPVKIMIEAMGYDPFHDPAAPAGKPAPGEPKR